MKKSKMIQLMKEFDSKFSHTRSMHYYFSEMLQVLEDAGMLPPEITIPCGPYDADVRIWEEEDEA